MPLRLQLPHAPHQARGDRATQARLQRLMRRVIHRALAVAFDGWVAGAVAARKQRQITERAMRRMLARCVSGAFFGWQATVAMLKTQRSKLTRVALRVQNRALVSALDAWLAFVGERARLRSLLKRAVSALALRHLRAAFNQWAAHVGAVRHERARLERAVRMLMQSKLLAAFQGWAARSVGKALFKQRLGRAVARWQSRRVAGWFGIWCDARKARAEVNCRGAELLLGRKEASMRHCLRNWRRAIEAGRGERTLVVAAPQPPHSSPRPVGGAMAHLLRQFAPDNAAVPETECSQGTLLSAYEKVLAEVSNLEESVASLEDGRAKRSSGKGRSEQTSPTQTSGKGHHPKG